MEETANFAGMLATIALNMLAASASRAASGRALSPIIALSIRTVGFPPDTSGVARIVAVVCTTASVAAQSSTICPVRRSTTGSSSVATYVRGKYAAAAAVNCCSVSVIVTGTALPLILAWASARCAASSCSATAGGTVGVGVGAETAPDGGATLPPTSADCTPIVATAPITMPSTNRFTGEA